MRLTVKYKERSALKPWAILRDSWKSPSTSRWLAYCPKASPQGCHQPARLCATSRNQGGRSEGSPGGSGLLAQTLGWVQGEQIHPPLSLENNCPGGRDATSQHPCRACSAGETMPILGSCPSSEPQPTRWAAPSLGPDPPDFGVARK